MASHVERLGAAGFVLDLSAYATPFFAALPLETVIACMREQQDRDDEAKMWRSYMALMVPIWGGKDADTFEAVLEKAKRRAHVTTREELDGAEEAARATAAAFGLL